MEIGGAFLCGYASGNVNNQSIYRSAAVPSGALRPRNYRRLQTQGTPPAGDDGLAVRGTAGGFASRRNWGVCEAWFQMLGKLVWRVAGIRQE